MDDYERGLFDGYVIWMSTSPSLWIDQHGIVHQRSSRDPHTVIGWWDADGNVHVGSTYREA